MEAVYCQALAHEFTLRSLAYERELPLKVSYKGLCVGEYRADFLIDRKIILEIKAVSLLNSAHEAQALHYVAATGLHLAILLNFGAKSLQVKRIVR